MGIHTLGDAWRHGWTARAVCQFMTYGTRSDRANIACRSVYDLDLQTLVWPRGERFPRDQLESRLRCPRCGQMRVQVVWTIPNQPKRNAAAV
jgi:hypothetical protein